MRSRPLTIVGVMGTFAGFLLLHYPLLRLPYFWDEAGYYIPAALDFYRSWLLIPQSTLPTGHTPLVMVYLALAWRVFGFSPLVTRAAMILVAAGTVVALYALARRVASREAAIWSALLLALSPMFFAQSSLVYLDLPVAVFTTLAVLALLEGQMLMFAVTASLAVLTKETAVVLLPVAWVFVWRRAKAGQALPLKKTWLALTAPLVPLAAWAFYYHHVTGFWTGNAEYLQYNLYATLSLGRIFWSLLRRLYEVFFGGFNWLLVVGAALGIWRGRAKEGNGDIEAQKIAALAPQERSEKPQGPQERADEKARLFRDFLFLAGGMGAAYVLMLSVVGGAILPRYLLPIFPALFLALVALVCQLPKVLARSLCAATLACFVGAWFINPSYPFPYEDNLAYRDFIHLHQQAAQFLEARPPGERILTAWPATDELARPFLGYVDRPLRVVPVQGFTAQDFGDVSGDSFDVLYLYSRKWEPPSNWLAQFPYLERVQEHYFDYAPQIGADGLAARYGLRLLARFEQRGQWVKIYKKQ
ncbi:MAG: glycosyltransferase family 39 protein [Acidobacteriia bacterium]|nr:glycosyltransferase family 39 protein [Terriglobia bacterium]